jgi:hypothetical protein
MREENVWRKGHPSKILTLLCHLFNHFLRSNETIDAYQFLYLHRSPFWIIGFDGRHAASALKKSEMRDETQKWANKVWLEDVHCSRKKSIDDIDADFPFHNQWFLSG